MVLLAFALIILGFIIGPMGTLWALNTISEEAKFGWYIPHAFWTYVPIWVLMLIWKSASNLKK